MALPLPGSRYCYSKYMYNNEEAFERFGPTLAWVAASTCASGLRGRTILGAFACANALEERILSSALFSELQKYCFERGGSIQRGLLSNRRRAGVFSTSSVLQWDSRSDATKSSNCINLRPHFRDCYSNQEPWRGAMCSM